MFLQLKGDEARTMRSTFQYASLRPLSQGEGLFQRTSSKAVQQLQFGVLRPLSFARNPGTFKAGITGQQISLRPAAMKMHAMVSCARSMCADTPRSKTPAAWSRPSGDPQQVHLLLSGHLRNRYTGWHHGDPAERLSVCTRFEQDGCLIVPSRGFTSDVFVVSLIFGKN